MIQVDGITIPVDQNKEETLKLLVAKKLKISAKQIKKLTILRRSVDARKKPLVYFNFSVCVEVADEKSVLKRAHNVHIKAFLPKRFSEPQVNKKPERRPVVVGAGPAGLFAAYILAKAGANPIVIERGKKVEDRKADVETFFKTGVLLPDSNVVFGEGGAGTFSDGKLNTSVKDRFGMIAYVRETFFHFGADESVLYDAKPHIGTDKLTTVIPSMREAICALGGTFYFNTKMEAVETDGEKATGVKLADGRTIATDTIILAIGHSARDTFRMLYDRGMPMEAKEFAVGFRVEHPQEWIDHAQYGKAASKYLAAAPYKLVAKNLPRAVYSFCMCPGGYVIDSSSEEGATCINGMSYANRDGDNANSAIVVAVGRDSFDMSDPMAAIAYQRSLEREVFARANGFVLQQLFGDFRERKASTGYGSYTSKVMGRKAFGDLRGILSGEMEQCFIDGMMAFERIIPRFAAEDVILSGIESRTSSPVRILRDDNCMSRFAGVFPCGEGAGYAGGIASAAMDGIRVAKAVIQRMNER